MILSLGEQVQTHWLEGQGMILSLAAKAVMFSTAVRAVMSSTAVQVSTP